MNKTTNGGPGRGQGRKPISEGQETVTVSIRLTAGQRQKLDMLGGAAWVRKWIDAGYQDACEAADKADFLEILLLSVLEKTGPVIISKNFELLPDRRRCLWITRATDDESDVVECRRHVIWVDAAAGTLKPSSHVVGQRLAIGYSFGEAHKSELARQRKDEIKSEATRQYGMPEFGWQWLDHNGYTVDA